MVDAPLERTRLGDKMKVEEVKICVLRIEGTNCEEETFRAFKHLGADPEKVHLKQLIGGSTDQKRRDLQDFQILVLPGGFSSGDYVRAGAIFASRIKSRLKEDLKRFVLEEKPVLGICNGFQILVEMGLLPGFEEVMTGEPQAALATNGSGRFECFPTLLKHENDGDCVFTHGLDSGEVVLFPSAHAEGNLKFPSGEEIEFIQRLEENNQIVFKYVDPGGEYAGYPWNPNGSLDNIAGICNPAGNVMGLMPHPERVFFRNTHPDWTRDERGPDSEGDGRVIFESVLEYATGL